MTATLRGFTYQQVAGAIDHSLLRPELTLAEVEAGCALADRYRVASACCRPAMCSSARWRWHATKARRAGGFKNLDASERERRKECREWLVNRRKELWRAGQKDDWKRQRRKRRYLIIKRATIRHEDRDDD